MREIIKIDDKTYRIEDGGVRFFLLVGENKALLVDTGMNCKDVKELVSGLTDLPIILINTHGDPDHISGNHEFDSFYMSISESDNYRQHGGTGEIIPVRQGDLLALGDRDIMVIDLPGHTPGSIALLDVNNRVLISGDSIQDGNIFMFGKYRNIEKYIKSLTELKNYSDGFDLLYPSHGTFPVNKDLIDKLIEGANKIVNGEVEGELVNIHGNDVCLYKFAYAGFLCEIKER